MSEDPYRAFGPLSPELCALLPQAQARRTAAERAEVRRHQRDTVNNYAGRRLRHQTPPGPSPRRPPLPGRGHGPGGEAVRIAASGLQAAERRVRELFPGETFTLQVDSPRPEDAG